MTKQYVEIRGLLNANKLDGLFGKGGSEEKISEVETKLDVRFPPSYRMFLKEFGWGYFGSLELIAGLGSDIPKEWERGANIAHVLHDEWQGPLRIPRTVLPFCHNGAGDWYAFDCRHGDGEESPIVFIAHEEVATNGFSATECAKSFADWIFVNLSDTEV